MSKPRFVFIDPDGTSAGGWLFVVVEAPTGVVYQQQYGGTACRQGQVEGFLVPLVGLGAVDDLRDLFERHFRGSGTWRHSWTPEELAALRGPVEGLTYWTCDGTNEEPHPVRLDDSRLAEVDEAWVPVVTPDGPGVLLWFNSD